MAELEFMIEVEEIEDGKKVPKSYKVKVESESEMVEVDYNGVSYTIYKNPSDSGIIIGTDFSACRADLVEGASRPETDASVYSFVCADKFDIRTLNTIMKIYEQAKAQKNAHFFARKSNNDGVGKEFPKDIGDKQ